MSKKKFPLKVKKNKANYIDKRSRIQLKSNHVVKKNAKKTYLVRRANRKCIHVKLQKHKEVCINNMSQVKGKLLNEYSEKKKKNDVSSIDREFKESESFTHHDNIDKSLENFQLKQKSDKTPLFVIKIINNKKENVPLEKIKNLFRKKKYKGLTEFIFPYITIGKFNSDIWPVDLKIFRQLFFYCPICEKKLRNYSIPFHIFQNHFSQIDQYLTQNEIANGCAYLLEKEYRKIKNSLNNFGDLAVLFNSCEIKGINEWSSNAEDEIEEIKKMKIEEIFFKSSLNDVKISLEKKLPFNKNKYEKRKYKEKDLDVLMLPIELKQINNYN